MNLDILKKIAGFVNGAKQQFYQTTATVLVTKNFYAFKPVGGNLTFDYLKEAGSDTNVATAYNVSGTFYQSEYYPGSFTSFKLLTGEILTYLTEQ